MITHNQMFIIDYFVNLLTIVLPEQDNPQGDDDDDDDDDDDIDGDDDGDDDDDDKDPRQHEPWGQKKVAGDKADPQGAL